jgi:hypothetical protein
LNLRDDTGVRAGSDKDIDKITGNGIREVYIDTGKGLDLSGASRFQSASAVLITEIMTKRSQVEVNIPGRSWRGRGRNCRPACAG